MTASSTRRATLACTLALVSLAVVSGSSEAHAPAPIPLACLAGYRVLEPVEIATCLRAGFSPALDAVEDARPAPAGAGGNTAAPLCYPAPEDDRCEQWVAAYDTPSTDPYAHYGWEWVTDTATNQSGTRLYVTGPTYDSRAGVFRAVVVSYDTTNGAVMWSTQLPYRLGALVASLAVAEDGRILVTSGAVTNEGIDIVTTAYTAAGKQQWLSVTPSSGDDVGLDIVTSPDGRRAFVAAGQDLGQDAETLRLTGDFMTLAYDTATGATLWSRRHDGRLGEYDAPASIAVSPDGARVYVAGTTDVTFDRGHRAPSFELTAQTVLAHDSLDGDVLWQQRADPGTVDVTVAVEANASGVFVTGSSADADDVFRYRTAAYAAGDGAPRWSETYDGTPLGGDAAYALALSPDGDAVYVTGASWGDSRTEFDQATVAYDAETGAQRWVTRTLLEGKTLEYGMAIAVAPDGARVYAAGVSGVNRSVELSCFCESRFRYVVRPGDFATIALDAESGSTEWTARLNSLSPVHAYSGDRAFASVPAGLDLSHPTGAILSPDGDMLFVTGWFEYPFGERWNQPSDQPQGGNYSDLAVLAYRL